MKTAIVTDDEKTISQHFGHADKYVVVEMEDSREVSREVREKPGHKNHDHTYDDHDQHEHGDKHHRMAAVIADCEYLLARGMGKNAKSHLSKVGVKVLQVDFFEIDEALQSLAAGTIEEHIDEQSCGHH